MALDATDKRLLNGMIWIIALAGLAYFIPGYGYQAQKEEEERVRETLKQTFVKYNKHYPQAHPATFGEPGGDIAPPTGELISALKESYSKSNIVSQDQIEALRAASRMEFPDWTEIPETSRKEPGVYFADTWRKKKFALENEWRIAKVECLDPDIGFGEMSGTVVQANENKARELLRELFIAQKIISLCIDAKKREEEYEQQKGVKPEAYMKIISVAPQPSVPTRPSALVPNPQYRKDEKNPTSIHFRKFNAVFWKNVIQEYPVEITLQCDVNTFMLFLHSVRRPGQFLVIRNLEILSPFMSESQNDKNEITAFGQKASRDGAGGKTVKDEHICVKISAAGMDFFDPEKYPNGLYEAAVKDAPSKTGVRRRRLPTGAQ
jgi:hypothetical protein